MTPNKLPPQGNITFLFTDWEGSTRMYKELDAETLNNLVNAHDARLHSLFATHNGYEVEKAGDGFVVAFQSVSNAIECAVSIQNSLAHDPIKAFVSDQEWLVRLRIGIYRAEHEVFFTSEGKYRDLAINLVARVTSLAIGQQILVTKTAYQAIPQGSYLWHIWKDRHLKNFDSPQDIYELLWDQTSRGEPGMRWLPVWYRESNRYIARRELERTVIESFTKKTSSGDGTRLVTLHGFGGMGKTRLALECALRMAAVFTDGVYFVSLDAIPSQLEGVGQVEAVAEAISVALNMPLSESLPRSLIARLQSSDSLIILDNFENVNHSEVVRFIADLLINTRKLRLLVTGRELLRLIDLEHLVLVGGMTAEEAITLFKIRAEAKGYHWQRTVEEDNALKRIVELLEYIPLAIELVAARLPYHELIELADQLEQQPLGELTETPAFNVKPGMVRHASLRRSLEWSFSLLEPETQEAFAYLGVFGDSFNTQCFVFVCELPKSQYLLSALQDAAILNRSREKGRSRYTMLRPVRAFAQEKFSSLPTANTLRQRYVAFYLKLANSHSNLNDSSHRAILEVEWRNIIYAVEVAETVKFWQGVVQLSDSLNEYLLLRGLWLEREHLNQRALNAARSGNDRWHESIALINLGDVYRLQSRWDEALACYEQSLDIRREFGDRVGEGQTLNNLGAVYDSQGRWEEALAAYEQSLDIRREFGDRVGEGQTLNNLGNVYGSQGRWDEALAAYEQDLAICREFGDRIGEGQTLNNLGNVYGSQGRWDEALACYEQSLDIRREFGDRVGEGQTLENVALLYDAQGDTATALHWERRALQVLQTTQDVRTIEAARRLIESWENNPHV